MKIAVGILILSWLVHLSSTAQHPSQLPRHLQAGPKGMDTTAFAEVVVFRDGNADFNHMWFSVMFDQPIVPISIINPWKCNIIRTKKQGNHTLYTKTYWADSIQLFLEYGKRHYVLMTVSKLGDKPRTSLHLLDEAEGEKRMQGITGKPIVRTMSLNDRNSNYMEDRYPDSLRWRAGKALFRFLRPPSMEVIKSHMAMVYHQPEISRTFSEFMTIMESKQKGVKDSITFFRFAESKGKENLAGDFELIELQRIQMTRPEFPNSVIYYVDAEDSTAKNKGKEAHLHARSVFLFLYIPGYNRKGGYYSFILSERGLPAELSTKEELLSKFERVWDSLLLSSE